MLVEGTAPGGTANAVEFFRGGLNVGSATATVTAGGPATFRAVLPASAVGGTLVAVQGGAASAPAAVEAGAGPDGDADGVPDWVELLASPGAAGRPEFALPSAVGGSFVTIDAGTHTLANVRALAAPADRDPAQFPLGLFGFDVRGVTPGGAATVQLALPAGQRTTGCLKWDPASGRVGGVFRRPASASTASYPHSGLPHFGSLDSLKNL